MSCVKEMVQYWIKELKNGNAYKVNNNDKNGFDILYISYKHRFKYFRPPMWKIFMWAYKVDRRILFKDCYPKSISTSVEREISMEFKCNPINNDEVDKLADKIKEAFDDGTKTSDEN